MAVILQPVDIKYPIDLGASFYSEVFTSGGFRAVGILTQGTRSSGAGFRNVSSAGFRAVSYFVRAALTVWATFSK